MKVTDVKVVSAQVEATVSLNADEVARLGIQVDHTTLTAIAQASLGAPTAEQEVTRVTYLQDDPNTLSDVVDERTAEIEADKQRLDRIDAAKADRAWDEYKENKV